MITRLISVAIFARFGRPLLLIFTTAHVCMCVCVSDHDEKYKLKVKEVAELHKCVCVCFT